MVLMPGNSFPFTYRAKLSGELHGESLTITSQLQFAYIKSILILSSCKFFLSWYQLHIGTTRYIINRTSQDVSDPTSLALFPSLTVVTPSNANISTSARKIALISLDSRLDNN